MTNHFRYRANIDRIWRRTAEHNPGYVRLRALRTIIRELFAPNPQAQLNLATYHAADPYDVARHKLRDLYDHASPTEVAPGAVCPALDAGAEASTPDLEQSEEDDDPL